MKNFPIPVLLIGIFVLLAGYWRTFFSFFQQDEWLGFARAVLLKEEGFISSLSYILTSSAAHYAPLNLLSIFAFFSLFQINYPVYTFVSLLLHLVVVFFVGRLAYLLFKDFKVSLAIALLFAVLASSFQATTWVVADISTHSSSIFGLLSIVLFIYFLQEKKKYLYAFSILSLFISLLFKEITIGVFLLLPIVFYLFADKILIKSFRFPFLILSMGGGYIFLRFISLFLFGEESIASASQTKYPFFIFNFLTLPIKGLVQSIFSPSILLEISRPISKFFSESAGLKIDTPEQSLFIEGFSLESVTFILFLVILFVFLLVWRGFKEKRLGKVALFGFIFVLLNSPIFAFSPEREGIITIVDSRNLYFLSIGAIIFLVSVLLGITGGDKRKFLVLFLPILILNIFWLNKEIDGLVEIGKIRKGILNFIQNTYLKLPDKAVFYTESNSSFYGLPPDQRIMPFQSGFGQTLLMWYYPKEQFPVEFFQNRFLWEITSEGYKETQNRGFGYFRNFDLLTKTLEEYKLSQDSVFSFRYDSSSKVIEDNTKEVRGRVVGFFANKKQILPVSLSSSHNLQDLHFITDGKRETFWDSKVPYAQPQSIEISLGAQKMVVQITIDSYNNKDQNEVGYLVLLSEDKQNWREVFYSKRYPPGADELIDLYFEPQKAAYIKIEQKGYHEYASWVIHELKLYETF